MEGEELGVGEAGAAGVLGGDVDAELAADRAAAFATASSASSFGTRLARSAARL